MNINLVKGAASLGQSQRSTYVDAMQKSLQSASQAAAIVNANRQAEKQQINAKVGRYIDNLNSEVDLTQLNSTQQLAVTNFLVENKNIYANAASEIARIDDPADPRYMELVEKINGVQSSFKNLAGQINKYKEDKIAYLKDFDDKRLSDGNNMGTLAEASKIYTDEAYFGIQAGGNLSLWNNNKNEYESYVDIQKPFLKDFKAADSILKLNESVYSTGQALSGARKNMIRNKLKNMINAGGRDTLLSLASDDFLIDGGLNLQDPSLFEPENQDMLNEAVLNSYMDALTSTAAQGANDKRPATGKGRGGFGGALKDEISIAEAPDGVVNDALNFSMLNKNVPANQREQKTKLLVNEINKIDTSTEAKYMTRGELYEQYLTVNKLDDSKEDRDSFKNEFGNSQIYSYNPKSLSLSEVKKVPINTDNPKDLYKFYLDNLKLSPKARNHFYSNYGNYTQATTSNNSSTNSSTNNFG